MILICENGSGGITLEDPRITSFPGLVVRGSLDLGFCSRLRAVREGLRVGRTLSLRGCTSLQSLPNGLEVGWKLDLEDTTALTKLPLGLQVGDNLWLRGSSVRELPRDLRLYGKVFGLEGGY